MLLTKGILTPTESASTDSKTFSIISKTTRELCSGWSTILEKMLMTWGGSLLEETPKTRGMLYFQLMAFQLEYSLGYEALLSELKMITISLGHI